MVGSDVPDHRLLKMTQLYFDIQSWIPLHTDSQYHAWVSGFNVSLDSIDIFERTVKITQYILNLPNDGVLVYTSGLDLMEPVIKLVRTLELASVTIYSLGETTVPASAQAED